ncbi:MAG: UTP--glucose-1-phosphate uridylyltransferase [Patescibacteria group bacterium]|nr:UTP--glucose-1-phosphate uridylyltransferase [Patescibacteria group bacterium]
MKTVKKVVILAAGLGTRFLPITKSYPKEMLPLIDKPILQYLVEEVVDSCLKDIVLVLSPEKRNIRNYFQKNRKLEYFLKKRRQKNFLLKEVEKTNRLVNLRYCYQKKPLGIGQALLCAEKEIKNEPFALFFADDVIASKTPCLKQMLKIYQKYQATILAVAQVPWKEVCHYGIVKIKKFQKRVSQVLDLVEKPTLKEAPSNLAIVGRYILEPEILKILKDMKQPKEDEELYLTDALKILLKKKPVYAYKYEGQWLSCGHKFDWLKANIELGLKHPETKVDLRKYLRSQNN